MRTASVIILLFISLLCANGQSNDFKQRYERFRQEAVSRHHSFRDKCNDSYAEFLTKSWESYGSISVKKPIQKKVPPVIFENKPIEEKEIVVKDTVAPPPVVPRPKPIDIVVPKVTPAPQAAERFAFEFYGDRLEVRAAEDIRFRLTSIDGDVVASVWKKMRGSSYDALLADCLSLRDSHNYCDWAYLQMLYTLSGEYFKSDNEAILLTAWLLCQTGYKVRLARADNDLCLLYGSKYLIYDANFFRIGGEKFYCLGSEASELQIADQCVFPGETDFSLDISSAPVFGKAYSNARQLKSEEFPDVRLESSVNDNLIKFYSSYPSGQFGDNMMTRWAMYANTPIDSYSRQRIYPGLQSAIKGKSQLESANILLNFVQTAFEYGYDDEVWGADRAFFAEETLYYPYSDCEDRSILFSKLVRDLLGLEVALVYYPNHLATAVRFDGEVKGDCLLTSHGRFTVCDPTYIGAPVGMTMEGMDNNSATIIYLK